MAGRVRVIVEPDPNPGSDATDLQTFGHEYALDADDTRAIAIQNLLKRSTSGIGADIHILARLPTAEYENVRKDEARRLGMRASALDREVARVRDSGPNAGQGQAVRFDEPQSCADPIDAATLLETLRRLIHRHVVVDHHAAVAITLWITITYLAEVLLILPFLCARSPVLRCGKTLLLTLIGLLAHRALATSNISPAAIFRVIEAARPTLIVDEFDTVAHASDELRGILNSGHTRATAFVVRLVGDDHEPRRFSTFGPKAIGLIGSPPSTILDRSIVIDMRRKNPRERIAKLPSESDPEIGKLRSMLVRFASDHAETIRSANPSPAPGLHDRAADNWSPLLAVADIAGGPWPELARQAAFRLSGGREAEAEGARVQLLEDIRDLFVERETDRLLSAEICEALAKLEHRPWPEFGRGAKPITPRQVARLLALFGIIPRTVRTGMDTAKGYHRDQFSDAFARYLPSEPSQRHNLEETRTKFDSRSVTHPHDVTDRKTPNPLETQHCDGVTAGNPTARRDKPCPRCDGEGNCRWCRTAREKGNGGTSDPQPDGSPDNPYRRKGDACPHCGCIEFWRRRGSDGVQACSRCVNPAMLLGDLAGLTIDDIEFTVAVGAVEDDGS
jgi:putative DNA primase/helicase